MIKSNQSLKSEKLIHTESIQSLLLKVHKTLLQNLMNRYTNLKLMNLFENKSNHLSHQVQDRVLKTLI